VFGCLIVGAGLVAVGRGGTVGFGLAVTAFGGGGGVVSDFDTTGFTGDGVLDLGAEVDVGEEGTLPGF
jgi:hypothetical protein